MKRASKTRRKKIYKAINIVSASMLVINMSFLGVFFVINSSSAQVPNQNMCSADVDAVLVMDRSESMGEGGFPSLCEWEELELVGSSYQCVSYNEDDLNQLVCEAKPNASQCDAPVHTPAIPNKITDAKEAANSFLSNLGTVNDQSALVSFADDASRDKGLTSIHGNTQSKINALTATMGMTNIGDAIGLANTELVSTNANPQANKIIILLTDGIANRPLSVLNPETYAEEKATESAAQNIKIFTVGLGNGVNETMLKKIASTTGAEYYYAPASAELENIYNQISTKICEYGSITVCKYNDSNNDGDISGEDIISDWTITLSGGANGDRVEQTDQNGCFTFAGLLPGEYAVSETITGDWQKTYPIEDFWTINLAEGEATTTAFANHLPSATPATSSISGYKFEDLDKDASTTKIVDEEWLISLFDVNASTTVATTTDSNGYYIFENLTAGIYEISEHLFGDWIQLLAPNPVNLGDDDSTDNNFINYLPICGNGIQDAGETCDDGNNVSEDGCSSTCQTESNGDENSYCGDGAVNQVSEQCDDGNTVSGDGCSSTCQTENGGDGGGGGGGGSVPQGLIISNEQAQADCDSAVITWLTNKFAASRVVYDTVSHSDISGETKPNYGYDFSSDENSNKVTGHSVRIMGLTSGATYYFRPISGDSSTEKTGKEIEIALLVCAGGGVIVLGEEGAPVLTIAKTVSKEKANPGETDIEFVITVKNEGSLTAFNAKLNDILPQGINFQDFDGNIKDWDLGDINPGEEAAVKYMVEVSANAAAKVYANNASASADNHASVIASVDFEVERVIVLAETGFKLSEFIILFVSFLTLAGSAIFIRSRQSA